MYNVKIVNFQDPAPSVDAPAPVMESFSFQGADLHIRKVYLEVEADRVKMNSQYDVVYWPFGNEVTPEPEEDQGQPFVYIQYRDEDGQYRTIAFTRATAFITNEEGRTIDKIEANFG